MKVNIDYIKEFIGNHPELLNIPYTHILDIMLRKLLLVEKRFSLAIRELNDVVSIEAKRSE